MTITMPHTPDGRVQCLCGSCDVCVPDTPDDVTELWRHIARQHADTHTAAPTPFPARRTIHSGVHRGIAWCTNATPAGVPCGYAQVPEGVSAQEWEIDADWCGDGWAGFDTGHLTDVWPDSELAAMGITLHPGMARLTRHLGWGDRSWYLERLTAECKRLADRLADLRDGAR